jgi:hypothetical protein
MKKSYIKIFSDLRPDNVEESVNQWIEGNEGIVIQERHLSTASKENIHVAITVMLVYHEIEEKKQIL